MRKFANAALVISLPVWIIPFCFASLFVLAIFEFSDLLIGK